MVDAIPHSTELLPPTRRYCLTALGLHRVAEIEGVEMDDLLRRRPVSARWRRVLLERLDALAVIYRLAAAVANFAHPIGFRWFRAAPMDAGVVLPDGRTVAVVRHGLTADRTGFAKRLWRLQGGAAARRRPAAPARRGAAGPGPSDAGRSALPRLPGPGRGRRPGRPGFPGVASPLRRRPPGPALRALPPGPGRWVAGGGPTIRGWSLPGDIDLGDQSPDILLPALLRPAEKRALDLLSDWPWASRGELAGLLGVSESAGVPTGGPAGRLRPGEPCRRPGNATPGPHRPGAGASGPKGPHLRWHGAAALEHSAPGPAGAARPGATSPAPAAASCSATPSTPARFIGS